MLGAIFTRLGFGIPKIWHVPNLLPYICDTKFGSNPPWPTFVAPIIVDFWPSLPNATIHLEILLAIEDALSPKTEKYCWSFLFSGSLATELPYNFMRTFCSNSLFPIKLAGKLQPFGFKVACVWCAWAGIQLYIHCATQIDCTTNSILDLQATYIAAYKFPFIGQTPHTLLQKHYEYQGIDIFITCGAGDATVKKKKVVVWTEHNFIT